MINPETIRVLGWCLLHFVWQGALLALVLCVLLMRLRDPQSRYGSAICALMLMILAPVITFMILRQPGETVQPNSGSTITGIREGLESVQSFAVAAGSRQILPFVAPASSIDWLSYAVLAWVAGVYMFTLRTLGAWMLLMRLRRMEGQTVDVGTRSLEPRPGDAPKRQ